MDNKKNNSFVAHPHLGFATKLMTFLLVIFIFNFNNLFASSTVKYDLEDFVNKCPYLSDSAKKTLKSTSNFQSAVRDNITYDNIIIQIFDSSMLRICFTNDSVLDFKNDRVANAEHGYVWRLSSGNGVNNSNQFILGNPLQFLYTECKLINIEKSSYMDKFGIPNPTINAYSEINNVPTKIINMSNINYLEGYKPIPEKAWFEFSTKKIGTTTLENEEGNINVYYPNSFKTWSNSYISAKEIGFLYIPKGNTDYNTTFSYITKKNLAMTQSWEYTDSTIIKEEETTTYIKYSINLENYLVTAPYFYNIKIKSTGESEDIEIKFVIINKNSTESGGIIIESGDQELSGDFTKDETTIGDIQNTITEPYDPSKNVLNQMTSGDILNNLGYQTTEDPNADLWDTIVNGLKNTLTETGEQSIEFTLRKNTYKISTNDLYVPNGVIKTFIGLFIDFWLLMQMFQFIKRTIDEINEGNLKVMHDVDADCYFF